MKWYPASIACLVISLAWPACAEDIGLSASPKKPEVGHYFAGNHTKLHAEGVRTGVGDVGVGGAVSASGSSGQTLFPGPGRRYFARQAVSGEYPTRTLSVTGGASPGPAGAIELPMVSATARGGINVMSYLPLPDDRMRAVKTPKVPYYPENQGKWNTE